MSAQGSVPAARRSRTALTIVVAAVVVVVVVALMFAYSAGVRAGAVHEILSATPAQGRRIAFVREAPCHAGRCQTLWMGTTREDARQVGELIAGRERCEAVAWAKDGYRVGFLINGYQLRVFDAETRKSVTQVNMFEPDATPSSRIARGITFSQNGAAVTYDDCPRYTSGCKSGMAAVR